METDFQLGKMKSFGDGWWCGDGECEYTSRHKTIHLEMAKMDFGTPDGFRKGE